MTRAIADGEPFAGGIDDVHAQICERDGRFDLLFGVAPGGAERVRRLTDVGQVLQLPADLAVHDTVAARRLGHVVAMLVEERYLGDGDGMMCRVVGPEVQGGDPSDHYRDRGLGPGGWSRNGIRKGGPKRPPAPRDGAWARRLVELRAERTEQCSAGGWYS